MRKNYLLYLLALVVLFFVGSCKNDGDPAPELTEVEKVTTILTSKGGKWNPSPTLTNWVMVEGVNVSELFKDFTLTFTSTGYTTTGTTPVWPRSGTWHFKDATAKVFIRDSDNKEITIETINETTLRVTLTWDQTTYGGREQSISGKHEFNLTK